MASNLIIRLLVDDKDVDKVDKTATRFQEAGGKIVASFDGSGAGLAKWSAAAGAVGGMVATVVDRGIDALVSFGGEALTASDSTQKFQQTLTFANVDTSAIALVTQQTKAYADQTVYDLITIQNTTAQLAANSVPDYEALTEAAGNLNAVSGGNADTFGSVAMVLTQTAGAGKLTTENWNQLADAIPGASGRLQAAMLANGAYTGNFREAMEKGQISAEEFNAALMQLGSEPVAVEAAKSTATFEGAIGNLQATLVGGLATALDKVKPQITGAISWASTELGTFFEWMSGAWDGLAAIIGSGDFTAAFGAAFGVAEDSPAVDIILSIRDGIISMGEAAAPVFQGIGDALAPLWPAVQELGGALALAASQTGVSAWGIFLAVLEGLTPVLGGIADTVLTVTTWLSENQAVVNGLVIAWAAWSVGLQLFNVASKIFTAYQVAAAAATGGLTFAQWALNAAMSANPIGLILTLIAALVGVIIWVATQTTFFQDVWNGAMTVIGAVATWLWESVLSPVFTAIGAVFEWVYNYVIFPIVSAIMLYIGLWAAVITWLWESVLSPVFTWIGDKLGLLGLGFQILWGTYVQPVINQIGAVFTWLWENVVNPVFSWIGDALDKFGRANQILWEQYVSPALSAMGTGFQWIWDSIISPVFNAIGGAVQWVGDTVRSIFGGIADFIGGAFTAVLGVVRGPINSLISMVNSVIDGINSIHVTIPDGVPIWGGQTIGFSISHVPYLASGGVTMGPMLAVVGDNPGGREMIQPVSDYRASLERVAIAVAGQAAPEGPSRLSRDDLDYLADRIGQTVYPLIIGGAHGVVKAAFGG